MCIHPWNHNEVKKIKKESPYSAGDTEDMGSIPGLGRSPGKGNGNPFPVLLPGKSHGRRSLEGCSPWGCKKLDVTLATKQ